MKLYKFLFCFLFLVNLQSKNIINTNEELKNLQEQEKEQEIIKKNDNWIIKKIKSFQQFINIFESGHDLKNLKKLEIGMTKSQVKKILNGPLEINCVENVYYYMYQKHERFFLLFLRFKEGKMVRLEFKNNKLIKITEIPMKVPEKNNK